MSIHYFDASTLVKYYLDEPGSTWVREIVDATMQKGQPVHAIYTSALSWVEVPAAVAIVRRTGRISNSLRLRVFLEFTLGAAARYHFIQADESVLKHAARLTQKYFLKSYDATHLATALSLKAHLDEEGYSFTFIAGDNKLLKAVAAEDIAIDNPFNHVSR